VYLIYGKSNIIANRYKTSIYVIVNHSA